MARIWLNHWFSTVFNIIQLIKADNPEHYVIGSNESLHSPIRAVCDEWYQEPALKDEHYVDFCLDFCKEHAIDVFMPRRGALTISKYKDRFEDTGTRVMVEEYPIMDKLNHKDQAYEVFLREGIGVVPEHYIVTTASAFLEAYHTLLECYSAVCFKFVRDEGGKSYRLIDNDRKGYAALFKRQNTRMTLDSVLEALSERETVAPIIVMPYLNGNEISVDCLKTDSGLIAIPRVKDSSRIERVEYDPQILGYCKDLYERIPLAQPCNIQFKYLDDVPYILEVNTRMSGGVQLACAATGVNIPAIAVSKLLGSCKQWHLDQIPKVVCHVETPIVL